MTDNWSDIHLFKPLPRRNGYHRALLFDAAHLSGVRRTTLSISLAFWLKVHDFEYFICLAIFCALSFRRRIRYWHTRTHTTATIDTFPCQNLFFSSNHLTFETCSPFSVDGDNFFPLPRNTSVTESVEKFSIESVCLRWQLSASYVLREVNELIFSPSRGKKRHSKTRSLYCRVEEMKKRIKYQLAYGVAWCYIEISLWRPPPSGDEIKQSYYGRNFISLQSLFEFQSRYRKNFFPSTKLYRANNRWNFKLQKKEISPTMMMVICYLLI